MNPTSNREAANGSGDPIAAEDLAADSAALRGLRAPADAGSGTAIGGASDPSFVPSPGSGIYTPPGLDPGDTPEAGDVDPGATASADETGQGGDVWEPKKHKALDWNG